MKARGKTNAATVAEYLAGLPEERRTVVAKLRSVVKRNMPAGYQEAMTSGMITWVVPLKRYPDTYNGHPLWYVALAAQKQHYSLHLMAIYASTERRARFEQDFRESGHPLDMGQACVRFKRLEDLPLDAIGQAIASIPLEGYVAEVDRITRQRKTKRR